MCADWLGRPNVDEYRGLNLKYLNLNRAFVIANTTLENVGIYSVADDCFNCPYQLQVRLKAGREMYWEVDTSVQNTWRIIKSEDYTYSKTDKRGLMCQMRTSFGEYGVYRLDVGSCMVKPELSPVNTYLPLLLCSLLLLSFCTIYTLVKFILKCKNKECKRDEGLHLNARRVNFEMQSVYHLRGLLLSLIIFTTTGGGGYPIFTKALGGVSLADIFFFIYVWSIGVKIPTVVAEAISKGRSKCYIIGNVLLNSSALTLVGTMIDSIADNTSTMTRSYPLERLGIAYFCVTSIYLMAIMKFEFQSKNIICKVISNFVCLLWCWVVAGLLISVFIILMTSLISFNCQANSNIYDPRADNTNFITEKTQNCNNYITESINWLFVGEPKTMIYVHSYYGFTSGIMGLLSTILYTMIGLKTGVIYVRYESHSDRLKLWGIWMTIFGIASIAFMGLSFLFKFNLWPISTIFFVSSVASLSLIIFYIFTEVWKIRSYILISVGVTSLALLCGHLLFSKSIPFDWQTSFSNHLFYLLQNIWKILLWSIIGIVLMRNNVKFTF